MKVVWLRTALRNLGEIATFIARDDPADAARVVRRIQDATVRLGRHPESGRPGRVVGTRELIVTGLPFILAYQVRHARVEILRVLHTSRRWPEQLP